MFQSATFAEAPRDPYDGVPLGVEAMVALIHEPTAPEGFTEVEATSDAAISLAR